jgi:peptidoglycan/LPS O-acetylase OafA/YrhL
MKHLLPVVAILVLHIMFVLLDGYSVQHLDSVMHFLGGVALGIFVTGQLAHATRRNWCPHPGKILVCVMIVALVASGAMLWETYEWLSDRFIGTHHQPTLGDTIKDLMLGLTGGIVYAYVFFMSNAYEAQLQADSSEHEPVSYGN